MSNKKNKTASMGKKEKSVLRPRLRFPGFLDAGEWEDKFLGQIFSERQETGFGSLPLLSLTDKEGIIPQESSNRKITANLDKSKYLRVCPGDVVYNTMRMWEGRSAFVDLAGVVSPAYTVCQPIGENDGLFFSYYFKTYQLIKCFRSYSQGLVNDTLNLKFQAFSEISIPTPRLPEQQKIADCLSSLDELITVQTQKLGTLNAHKKGLMQQLFPVEGKTLPRLRFPEFQDAGEWDARVFREVVSLSFYGISNSTSVSGAYPVLRMGNMVDGKLEIKNLTFIDLSKEEFKKFELKKGDILLNRTNSIDLGSGPIKSDRI